MESRPRWRPFSGEGESGRHGPTVLAGEFGRVTGTSSTSLSGPLLTPGRTDSGTRDWCRTAGLVWEGDRHPSPLDQGRTPPPRSAHPLQRWTGGFRAPLKGVDGVGGNRVQRVDSPRPLHPRVTGGSRSLYPHRVRSPAVPDWGFVPSVGCLSPQPSPGREDPKVRTGGFGGSREAVAQGRVGRVETVSPSEPDSEGDGTLVPSTPSLDLRPCGP